MVGASRQRQLYQPIARPPVVATNRCGRQPQQVPNRGKPVNEEPSSVPQKGHAPPETQNLIGQRHRIRRLGLPATKEGQVAGRTYAEEHGAAQVAQTCALLPHADQNQPGDDWVWVVVSRYPYPGGRPWSRTGPRPGRWHRRFQSGAGVRGSCGPSPSGSVFL